MKAGFALMALLSAATAMATNGGAGVPHYLTTTSGAQTTIWFSVPLTGTVPSCATYNGTWYNYVFDSSTAGGKTMLASLLAANTAQTAVYFTGSGTCSLVSTVETLVQVQAAN